jgi:signal peptidase I
MSNFSTAKKIRLGILLTALLAVAAAKAFFINNYRIPQNGMYPTLPAGSTLFAWRHPYANATAVKRGDIVIFPRVEDGRNFVYVWRVVALPGETVVTTGDSLTINGKPVTREHLRDADGKAIFREQNGDASYEIAINAGANEAPPDVTLTVPPDQVYVMGENRLDAHDSRYFGPIPVSSIIGKKL